MDKIRNFCIIAHIDHGKSTLADRMLELTGTVDSRKMRSQFLDQMDLERERGITIKLQPVRMSWTPKIRNSNIEIRNKSEIQNFNTKNDFGFRASDLEFAGSKQEYILNLIDTPGHVDFTYEVSRSLAAVEGAILLVDATQGIQAQTIANLHLALEQDLKIIPVINKIDLPAARPDEVRRDIVNLLGCTVDEILSVSAKTGEGVTDLLDEVVKRVPAPTSTQSALRALIFDSQYSDYHGVVAYIRVMDGLLKKDDLIQLMAHKEPAMALEVGVFKPGRVVTDHLGEGEIGYVITGIKDIRAVQVGDTITAQKEPATIALAGYKKVQPMVFAGFYPTEGDTAEELREALGKVALSDSALQYEPEHSAALGFGFRCGFLGLLHLDIIQERLRREYKLELVITVPTVAYQVYLTNGQQGMVKSPQELVERSHIREILEPVVDLTIVTPSDYIGSIMPVVQRYHGEYRNTQYLEGGRALLEYTIPLASILVDFYDQMKSASSGYASMNYEFKEYRKANIVRMEIMVAEEPVEPLAMLVYDEEAGRIGRQVVERLKETLPRQMFEVKIQATIGARVVASERISAMRKDVLAKMSGGDFSRKRKLLEKQKKGKKKMRSLGSVEIPSSVYLEVLKHRS